MGDYDRHNQPGKNVNKSFDSILDEMGAHSWQHWFVFEGPAESRLIEVTDDYRTGLIEWGSVRIAPPGPFVCQDSELIMPRFRDETYACFDVRDMDQSAIEQMLEAATTRLLLYGTYALIDCPVALLETCYDHITFINTIQHEAQTNNVGAGPVIVFDGPFTPNPWNLIYIGVYAIKEELEEDCGAGADACAFGYPYTGRIGITEKHLEPHSSNIGINEGETNYYYYNIQYPDDCHIAESHNFADHYANDDPCREAIIMQMNSEAYEYGQRKKKRKEK